MPSTQSLKNHTRFDPPFHFFLAPVLLLNIFVAVYVAVRHWPVEHLLHLWLILISVALLVLAGRMRNSALQVQDRVIRLEERLRLTALLPSADLARLDELSTRQLIALRFASNAEVPALVHKVLTQQLDPKAIKQNIQTWRPDFERV